MAGHSDSLQTPVSAFFLPLVVAFPGVVILALAVALNWGR